LSPRLLPLGTALVSAAAFGASGPLAKPLIVAGLGPTQVAWLRVAGAAVVLLPATVRGRALALRHPLLLTAYGVLAVAGVQAAYFGAVSRIPVSVALLIEYLAPALVLLIARFTLGRRVAPAAAVGAGVTVVGLAGVVEVWSGVRFDPLGLLSALMAAGCLAAYFLLSERQGAADPAALLGWGLLIGALVLTVVARPWTASWSVLAAPVLFGAGQVPASMVAAGLVLIGTIVAYLTGIVAVRRLSAPVAAVIATSEAVVATLLAWVLLGEALSVPQLMGGAVVLVGVCLAQLAVPSRGEDKPDPPAAGSGEPVVVRRLPRCPRP
jgi:drug/metabolite transporter (DMT)-like permease